MPQVLWPCRYFLSYLFCLGNPHSALKTDVKYSLSVEVFFMVLYPWMELIHLIRTLKAPYQNVHIPLQWYSLRACPTPRWDHRQSKHKICVFLTHLHFFFKIFLMWTIYKVFIEFVTTLLLLYALSFWPRGMWDPSSLTRDQTCTPCPGRRIPNHWTAREILLTHP